MASLKKNSIYNTLLNVCNVIYPLITAPYLARVLDPAGIGLFNFATTYANYFAMVAVLGIPTYGIRAVAQVRDNKKALTSVVSELISYSLFSTIIVAAIYLISLLLINKLNENFLIFIVAGIVVYLAPLRINWFFQGVENFSFMTIRTVIIRVLSIIALFLFVRTKEDVIVFVLIYALGGVLGDLWNFFKMKSEGIHPYLTIKGLKKHSKPIFILFASAVAISIYSVLDTTMLGFMSNYSEVGYYNSATHISKAMIAIVTSLSAVAVPRVSFYVEKGLKEEINTLIEKSFSIVSFFVFPFSIGLVCVAPTFIPLFLGDQFAGSILPLQILSFLIIAIGLNNLLGVQVLIGLGKDSLFLYAVIIGAIVNFILNLLLIPNLASVGASVSSLVAETLIMLVEFIMAYKYTDVRIRFHKEIIYSFLFSLVFIPIVYFLSKNVSGWILIFLAVCVCSVWYAAAHYFAKSPSFNWILSMLKINTHHNNN